MLATSPENYTLLGSAIAFALILHIGAGCVAILAGGAALAARKGERVHRAAGSVFFVAMLTMCAFATYLSVLRQPGTIIGGIFTGYLVVTAWATVRRPENAVGRFDKAAFAVAVGCAVAEFIMGALATGSATGRFLGYPAPLFYVFGAVAALAAALDLTMIRGGGVAGARRIARHLWRMCLALFMASASFFLGQQKVMPAFMHGSPILVVLGVAPLLLMVFWLGRVLLTNVFNGSANALASSARGAQAVGIAPR